MIQKIAFWFEEHWLSIFPQYRRRIGGKWYLVSCFGAPPDGLGPIGYCYSRWTRYPERRNAGEMRYPIIEERDYGYGRTGISVRV